MGKKASVSDLRLDGGPNGGVIMARQEHRSPANRRSDTACRCSDQIIACGNDNGADRRLKINGGTGCSWGGGPMVGRELQIGLGRILTCSSFLDEGTASPRDSRSLCLYHNCFLPCGFK